LRNVIERAMVLEDSEWIQLANLQIAREEGQSALAELAVQAADSSPDFSLEEAEKSLLRRALEKAGGNQTRAAVMLGITRDTLRYKMKKFDLR
jgi:DNA-binding NtrC family response regulator